jgi:CBS domain containing-hemolysin-like protein
MAKQSINELEHIHKVGEQSRRDDFLFEIAGMDGNRTDKALVKKV